LLVGQAAAALDKVQVERAIDFEEAQIKALEQEIAASESKPLLSQRKAEEPLEAETKSANKEGATLMISVNEDDADQIPLRLPKLIKAQNHKFSGGKWLVYDNSGVKPSQQMRQVMEKAMADNHVDGWMEVDYSQEGLTNLYQKVGMRFAPNTPEGNLAHYWMMDQCETEYCAHYDLSVVSYAQDGYSWVDRSINVMNNNEDVMQVVSATPPTKARELINFEEKGSLLESAASFTASTCQQVMSEAHEYQGKRFITGRMFLMHKARYQNLLPIAGSACKRSDLRWEEVMSCESCRNNLKRASLSEGSQGWHLDFQAPAGPQLERALNLVDQGVAVTSRLIPHRAAAIELWEMEGDFEALHPSF
jgi:hypothetical protein